MKDSKVLSQLVNGVMRDLYAYPVNNIDYWRFQSSASKRLGQQLKTAIIRLSNRAGFARKNAAIDEVARRLIQVLGDLEGLERFYDLLNDQRSRNLLIDLLKFRVLGSRHAVLPSNTEDFWQKRATIDGFCKQRNSIKTELWKLNRYQMDQAHGSVELHSHPLGVLNNFLLEQYAYKKANPPIRVNDGDVVMDVGGCWGETALYFAHQAGANGRIYCFEFVPESLRVLERNLEINANLARRIKVIESPAWSRSGETLRFQLNGPGTTLASEQDENTFVSVAVAIDDVVRAENIPRVDFIKMDVEGAELAALEGAAETIRAFKPQLAIAVYHREDDFIRIPDYLNGLNLGYEFFLDHFSIHREETILFARAGETGNLDAS